MPVICVVGRSTRDVEHLVLCGERRQLVGDARVARAADDLVSRTNEALEVRHGGRRVVRVVVPRNVESLAVHLIGTHRRVLETDVEALTPFGLVGGIDPRLFENHPYLDRRLRRSGA